MHPADDRSNLLRNMEEISSYIHETGWFVFLYHWNRIANKKAFALPNKKTVNKTKIW
jgi:hypothetical protein